MAELNWTYASLVILISTISELFAFSISISGYRKMRYPHFLYMSLAWLFLSISSICLTVAYVSMNFILYRIAITLNIPITFSLMFLMDSISSEKVDVKKTVLITIISTAMVIATFLPNAVRPNITGLNETTPALSGFFNITGIALFAISGLMWIYYMLKLHIHAPRNLKRYSRINLIGAIIAGAGGAIAFTTRLVWFLPGTDYLFMAVGSLICAYAFIKQPKLGYVLPFKVNRLISINAQGGMPTFTYSWEPSNSMNSTLFSGALHSISAILSESISKGPLKEILLDNGILIIHRSPNTPLFFVLITSKSSPILFHGLKLFEEEFTKKFGSEALNGVDLTDSDEVKKIVKKSFPFLPEKE